MNCQGLTLIELCATLLVVTIIVSVGYPMMDRLVIDARLSAVSGTYLHGFNTARYAAVASGRDVTLCTLATPGNRCSGNWSSNITIFYDDNRNGTMEDRDDLIMHTPGAGSEKMRITLRAFGGQRFLTLRSTGLYRRNGTFTLCPPPPHGNGRSIIINAAGRARTERVACSTRQGR